jgi:threonine/homoserine/homoserine lactone efflux protein
MPIDLYLAFIAATAVLMIIPGPNVALIVANSVAHGTRYGLLTVAATSSAVVVHLTLTVVGAAAVLDLLAQGFDWLRWLGVAYLVWLGIATWRTPAVDLAQVAPQARAAGLIFLRGFLVGLTNPKTLLFYGAFFPQFITPGPTAPDQLLLLAITFLCVALVFDSSWAILAGRLRVLLVMQARLRSRVSGGLLVGAGLGLALARRT